MSDNNFICNALPPCKALFMLSSFHYT